MSQLSPPSTVAAPLDNTTTYGNEHHLSEDHGDHHSETDMSGAENSDLDSDDKEGGRVSDSMEPQPIDETTRTILMDPDLKYAEVSCMLCLCVELVAHKQLPVDQLICVGAL